MTDLLARTGPHPPPAARRTPARFRNHPPLRPIAAEVAASIDAGVRQLDDHTVGWFHLDGDARFGPEHAEAIARVIDDAAASGIPLVGVFGTAMVDPSDGVIGLAAWGRVARSLAAASGIVPTILVLDGPFVTGMALVLGLADVCIATEAGVAYVSGPRAVATLTGRIVDPEALGGSAVLHRDAAVVALEAADLDDALDLAAGVLDHLPANNLAPLPRFTLDDPPDRPCLAAAAAVPHDSRHTYDMRRVITDLVDDGATLELHARSGGSMLCVLARLGGRPVGIVASQPSHLAGAIDIESSQKAARFVQWCDAFGLPIVTLVDTPGYRPGRDLETAGMIRYGGQLAFAYAAATVPRICVIVRKAYGGAYIVMDCKTMGNDLAVAWPGAEIAVMGAAAAVQIVHGRALSSLPDEAAMVERLRLEAEYADAHVNPHAAAARGYVDAVIDPATTRAVLCRALPTLAGRRHPPVARKHTNGPL